MREQLFINGIEIPLSRSLDPSFTRSITDIKNPEKRNATYSKSVTVPNSKEANVLFASIWDINIITSSFDVTKKADCRYILNGAETISGYCQLKEINITDNKEIEYSIVIYSEFANLMKSIQNLELTDLTGLDVYDHIINQEVQNWSTGNDGEPYQIFKNYPSTIPGALGVGYIYPLIDFGLSSDAVTYDVMDIACCIYAKEYWDRIHDQAGFTYEFLDSDFEDHFKHLIVPGSPDNYKLSSDEIANREFKANTAVFDDTGTSTSNNLTKGSFSTPDTIIFTVEELDLGGVYNNVNGKFTAPALGRYSITSIFDIFVNFKPNDTISSLESLGEVDFIARIKFYDASAATTTTIEEINFRIKHEGFSVGNRNSTVLPTAGNPDYFTHLFLVDIPREVNPPNRVQLAIINKEMNTGDQVYIEYTANYETDFPNYFRDGGGAFSGGNATLNLVSLTPSTLAGKISNTNMLEGSIFEIERAIPEGVKQLDFLMNYIKEYNLFVDIDPDDPKHLIYAPRDTFYNTDVIDLREKVSIDKGIVYNPVGALDAKEYLYKHKDDDDYLNQKYKSDWLATYGQRSILTTNDFSEKVSKTEVPSSPTPLADQGNGNNRVVSTILKVDELGNRVSTKFNWRTLYYGGLKDNFENWVHQSAVFPPISQTQYPYAGHFDDPFNPTLDINFGLVREVYYYDFIDDIVPTDNNLYNKYHSKYIREITDKDSKLVEAFVNMDAVDFKTWSFRNLYYFDNAYFRLQEVQGFNPTSNELTKCVFLKLKEVSPFKPTLTPADGGGSPFEPQTDDGTTGGEVNQQEFSPLKGITQSPQQDGNNYNARTNEVTGEDNFVSIKATNVNIKGDSNQVYSGVDGATLIDSNNNIISAGLADVVLINTDGVTVTESGVTYIGGQKVNPDQISLPTAVETVTTSQTVSSDVLTYMGDTSSGDITMTFNLVGEVYTEGQIWNFKKVASSNQFIISISGGTIDGAASINIATIYDNAAVQYDGTNFIII
jgi:hypothetical protein